MNRQEQRYRIRCDVGGRSVEGNYWLAGNILVVSTAKGGTSRQLADHDPAELAACLLRKLAEEGKA